MNAVTFVVASADAEHLSTLATLVAGAAASGRGARVLVMPSVWSAFTSESSGPAAKVSDPADPSWRETLREAKQIGAVEVYLCSSGSAVAVPPQWSADGLIDGVRSAAQFFGSDDATAVLVG